MKTSGRINCVLVEKVKRTSTIELEVLFVFLFFFLLDCFRCHVVPLAYWISVGTFSAHTQWKSVSSPRRSCARGAMALLFVLGATWTFGVLHILHETTLTAYLFTITNTFQGMFIFIFLCVLSRKVRLWLGFFFFFFFFCIYWPVRHLVFKTLECKKVHHQAVCMCSL